MTKSQELINAARLHTIGLIEAGVKDPEQKARDYFEWVREDMGTVQAAKVNQIIAITVVENTKGGENE